MRRGDFRERGAADWTHDGSCRPEQSLWSVEQFHAALRLKQEREGLKTDIFMECRKFQLSPRGLEQASVLESKDFRFIVGGCEYACCRFQACFFSRRVCRLLMSDTAVDHLVLKVEDAEHRFNSIIGLMSGGSIDITVENASFLERCARELENEELLAFIVEYKLESQNLNLADVVERIHLKHEFHRNPEDEIKYIAGHFHELDLSFVSKLSVDELEEVLESPALKLKSEDQLLDLIFGLITKSDQSYSSLLRNVQFQFLEQAHLNQFLDRVFPDLVDASIWSAMCKYVRMFSESSAKEALLTSERYYFWTCMSSEGPFNGIISRLTEKYGGNVHRRGAVDITASSNYYNECYQVVDYGWNGWWFTDKEPNAYIQFDFKHRAVSVSEYSIRSNGSTGGFHLLSWVIEASVDGSDGSWEVIDSRTTNDLNGRFIVKTYQCNQQSNKFFRYIRLRQTAKNSGGQDNLFLSEIEFFGRVKEP